MLCREEETSVFWIDDDAQLAEVAPNWEDAIGLDTEFIRTDTFYPIAGLYQVASGDSIYLLDPLHINDWTPFVRVLEDAQVTKVMHSCQEDLELMAHHLRTRPTNLFDTQIANAFVCPEYSLSYAKLVDRICGVALEKQETRSNWLRRPLSDQQISYARGDVLYLVPMYRHLEAKLQDLGRGHWFDEEMRARGVYREADPNNHYHLLKRAWTLKPRELARLQALCRWREQAARELNVPRGRVVWDEHLLTFACMHSLTVETLRASLPRHVAGEHGQALIAAHDQGSSAKAPQVPAKPLTSAQTAHLNAMRQLASEQAASLGFATELLSKRRDVEACLREFANTGSLSAAFLGWRGELVGQGFMHILAERG